MLLNIAVIVFTVLTSVVIIFQGCLIAGLPWGAASMGGKYPGVYPAKMKAVALVNIAILVFVVAIGLAKAGWALPRFRNFSVIAMWFIVGFFALGTIINTITPSKIERIWAPVAFLQLCASLIIALQ